MSKLVTACRFAEARGAGHVHACSHLPLQILEGHTDEIFSCAFNYEGDTVITGSKDNTCRIWRCS